MDIDEEKMRKRAEQLKESETAAKETTKQLIADQKGIVDDAKSEFRSIQKDIIIPMINGQNTANKEAKLNATFIVATNEQLDDMRKVTENFIQVTFHANGGTKIYPYTPYFIVELIPAHQKLIITSKFDLKGGELKNECTLEELRNRSTDLDSYLSNFIDGCMGYRE